MFSELAHDAAIKLVSIFKPKVDVDDDPHYVWGLKFNNLIGLAAGFDKNADAVEGWFSLGFGFVEIGTVTLRPRKGNPKPRLFRVDKNKAIINNYGLPSKGAEYVARKLERLRRRPGPIGINIIDHETANILAPYADYMVVNTSCPNTHYDVHIDLIKKSIPDKLPLLLKLSPHIPLKEIPEVDGFIVGNSYPIRRGGLSGRPIKKRSTEAVKMLRNKTDLPIIGCGGILTKKDVKEKTDAGANLVQIYSALVYRGHKVVKKLTL